MTRHFECLGLHFKRVTRAHHLASTCDTTLGALQVGTRDHQLVLRHDITLDDSTNVADLTQKGGQLANHTQQTLCALLA